MGLADNRWSLKGMSALVTGGTKGIGFFSLSLSLSLSMFHFKGSELNSQVSKSF